MIDCCIVIEPDADMAGAIDRHLSSPYLDSINHTKYRGLVDRPISVNMEVKRTGEHWDHAQLQCGMWATAQYTWLKALGRGLRAMRRLERQAALQHQQQQPQQQMQEQEVSPPPQLPQRLGDMTIRPPSAPASDSSDSGSASTPLNPTAPSSVFSAAAAAGPRSATDTSICGDDQGDDEVSMIPFLPLVIVQGHDWHFLAASPSSTGTVRRCFLFWFFVISFLFILFGARCRVRRPPCVPSWIHSLSTLPTLIPSDALCLRA
jgi:hypothetical protein